MAAAVAVDADVAAATPAERRRPAAGGGRGGRGGGRAPPGAAAAPGGAKIRYIKETEMEERVQAAALAQGFDEAQAVMLASCGRNMYALGCDYHPSTITLLQELCRKDAEAGEPWAVLLLRCVAGQMPRLRSAETASARMAAAKAAAARKQRQRARAAELIRPCALFLVVCLHARAHHGAPT